MKNGTSSLAGILVLGSFFAVVLMIANRCNADAIEDLRCEYMKNPLGINEERPRLSWKLASGSQSAYQIIVDGVWDSGKVASDQSVGVVYEGKPLLPGLAYTWKVKVWDKKGQATPWSESATFSMGLKSWKAQWIGYDASRDNTPFNTRDLHWVGLKKGEKVLLRKFSVPKDRKVRRAVLALYADDRCLVSLNGKAVGESVKWESTAQLDVTAILNHKENEFSLEPQQLDGLSPAVVGRLVVQFESGEDWQLPVDASWENAAVLEKTPWDSPALNDIPRLPAPYLRKEFTVEKKVQRAMIYVTALGAYNLHLNGQIVGHDELNPGWTDFNKRVEYQTYDVTEYLKQGRNSLGAILGEGWYASVLGYTGRDRFYGGNPRLLSQLVIEYADSSEEVVCSDASWKAAFGPIQHADLLLGCEIDARKELPGWDLVGFDDSKWAPITLGLGKLASDKKEPLIQGSVAEMVRRQEELPALKLNEPSKGIYIFDLGQNMAGWARLKAKGAAGQRLTVRYGEMLNSDGSLYTANLRGATATDFFILSGKDEETFESVFTFHGFRYVEVRGLKERPGLDAVAGVVVHSEMEKTGTFECSSPLLNQLFHNIIWGQKSNYLAVPTDCPQRDERAGWTGDTQFFIPTAAYNFNVAPFFTRWLTTLCEDSQFSDGSVSHVAPDLWVGGGSTAWGDAAIICTYNIYHSYGDTRVIQAHWTAMKRLLAWYESKSVGLIPKTAGWGDWLNLGGSASPEVIDTAYFAYLSGLMAEMATAIGETSDAVRFKKLHNDIKTVFAGFFDKDGALRDSSQTGYALAFSMDLVPPKLKEKAREKFAAEIKRFNWHLATGFIGTPRLLPGLHAAGLDDLAYRLLLTEDYPSWLFQVKNGATTMWERWDGWTPEKGFQWRNMNSFNHYAFGSVGEYLYAGVAGIRAEKPGYKVIRIQPMIEEGLTWAKTSFDSPYGKIISNWTLDSGWLSMDVTIPPNTTANIYVPGKKPVKVDPGNYKYKVKYEVKASKGI